MSYHPPGRGPVPLSERDTALHVMWNAMKRLAVVPIERLIDGTLLDDREGDQR